ncbi:MAG TPA: hypothetical protein VF212_13580 [Longimicrobiales bacterium]
MSQIRIAFLATPALLTACGFAGDRASPAFVEETLAVADTVVTTESALIGYATDLAVGPGGRLYLTDARLSHVLTVGPGGEDPRTIGREGSGPGEFATPWSLAVSGDGVWVFDMRHGRVLEFDAAGGYVGSYVVGEPTAMTGIAPNARGELAAATGGRDSALVAVLGADGERLRAFGEPVVPPVTMWDFTSIKDRIRRGEVPAEFRNSVRPAWAADGSVVVAFDTEREVRRYGPDGALVWARPLEDPALEAARAEFVRANTEDPDPTRLAPLRYVRDVFVAGDEVWLLLDTTTLNDGVVLVLDATDGAPRRRLVLPGLPGGNAFALDAERGRLYLAVGDEAMVVVAEVGAVSEGTE